MSNQVTTYNGYDMFEVVSALQKSIRRGLEGDAVYWGVELYISGFGPYAWKRLKIISVEDVGLANPYAPLLIDSLKSLHDELASKDDKKKQYRMPFVEAIIFLCKCKKSRLVDWCQNYWFDEIMMNGGKEKIPDYAIDIHTRKGKAIGKTIENFFNEGSHIENASELYMEDFYKEKCHERWTDEEWNSKCKAAKEKYESSRFKEAKPSNGRIGPNHQFDLFD